MMYIFLIIFLAISVATIIGAIRLKIWESHGRLVNGNWLDEEQKLRLMSRWGAGH